MEDFYSRQRSIVVQRAFVMMGFALMLCDAVSRSSRGVAGPFTSTAARPLICPNATGGAIDPSSFVDANGTRYVVFKNNGNAVCFFTFAL